MTEKMGGAEGTKLDLEFVDMERVSQSKHSSRTTWHSVGYSGELGGLTRDFNSGFFEILVITIADRSGGRRLLQHGQDNLCGSGSYPGNPL